VYQVLSGAQDRYDSKLARKIRSNVPMLFNGHGPDREPAARLGSASSVANLRFQSPRKQKKAKISRGVNDKVSTTELRNYGINVAVLRYYGITVWELPQARRISSAGD
jgi:hypothetical protein